MGPQTQRENGNNYILTFLDDLTAVSIRQQDADAASREFVAQVILRYAIPAIVLADQGAKFLNEMFKNVCILLKIKKIQSTAYHPETKVGLARSHRVLTE